MLVGRDGHGIGPPYTWGGSGMPLLLQGARVSGNGMHRHATHISRSLKERPNMPSHRTINLLLPGLRKPLSGHPTHKTNASNPHWLHRFLSKAADVLESAAAEQPKKKRKHGK